MLQCVAECCRVSHVGGSVSCLVCERVSERSIMVRKYQVGGVVLCCSVLQHVVTCYSVLQRVAACYRVLQSVSECCIVLQIVACW